MAAIEWWIYVLSAYELIHLCKSSDRLGPDKTELLLSRTNRPSIRYITTNITILTVACSFTSMNYFTLRNLKVVSIYHNTSINMFGTKWTLCIGLE